MIQMNSLSEYLEDKKRIKKLERKISSLNDTIFRLRKRLGEKPAIDKSKLVELLLAGLPTSQAAKLSSCSLSTADRTLRQLKDAGAIAERESKKENAISMIEAGASDKEISSSLGLCNGYVRSIRTEIRNAIRNK